MGLLMSSEQGVFAARDEMTNDVGSVLSLPANILPRVPTPRYALRRFVNTGALELPFGRWSIFSNTTTNDLLLWRRETRFYFGPENSR
jgi:hypothetical protein